MNKKICLFIAIASLSFIVFMYFKQDDSKINNLNWKCNQSSCSISFEIENRSNKNLNQNIIIRAIYQINGGKGSGGTSTGILGEDNFKIALNPHETQNIKKNLNLYPQGTVSIITVNNWDSDN